MASAGKRNQTTQAQSFEELLSQFEQIVTNLEDGDLPLDKSIELFEKGMSLSAAGMKKLDDAEKRVQLLLEQSGKERKQSFEPTEEEED